MKEGRDPIKDLIVESGLDPEEHVRVADVLEALQGLVPEQAPAPSAELAAMLTGGIVTPLASPRRRHRTALLTGAVVATVALGTGVAAASNTLPEPAQRFLHDLSHKVLPFDIPSPDERDAPWRFDPDPLSRPGSDERGTGQGKTAGQTDADKQSNGVDPLPGESGVAGEQSQGDQPPGGMPTDAPSQGPGSNNAGGQGSGQGTTPPKAKPTAPPGKEKSGERPEGRPSQTPDQGKTDEKAQPSKADQAGVKGKDSSPSSQ